MAVERLERHSITTVTVVGHPPYGLTVRSHRGELGFVDSMHIDPSRPRSEWPAIGTDIEIVVLGYTNESRRGHVDRLRGDARLSSLTEVRSWEKTDTRHGARSQDVPTSRSDNHGSAG